jgi:hypothetical protein
MCGYYRLIDKKEKLSVFICFYLVTDYRNSL